MDEAANVKMFYKTLTTAHLKSLREAFATDKRIEADNPLTTAFCDGRIAVIDELLRERGEG